MVVAVSFISVTEDCLSGGEMPVRGVDSSCIHSQVASKDKHTSDVDLGVQSHELSMGDAYKYLVGKH